jgi:hypothetical protein
MYIRGNVSLYIHIKFGFGRTLKKAKGQYSLEEMYVR